MIRRSIIVILVLAVLAIGANDAWRYVQAQQRLRDTTYTVARWAAENAPSQSRDAIAAQLVTMAAPSGVTVTMYGQNDTGVQVWAKTEVPGTIVTSTLANLLVGKSLAEASASPMTIKDYREAGIR